MIPLLHDFSGATVLIFGGGSVGARKARRFAREARVIVLSPSFKGEFGDAELVRAAPDEGDASRWIERADPALVVAATDDAELNAAIEAAARDAGALVNRADERGARDPGSVVVPATVRSDPVVIAIATGGASPALSKHLRCRIESELDELPAAGEMAELTAEVGRELRERGVDPDRRRAAVSALVESSDVWKALRTGAPNREQVVRAVIDDALNGGDRR